MVEQTFLSGKIVAFLPVVLMQLYSSLIFQYFKIKEQHTTTNKPAVRNERKQVQTDTEEIPFM